MSAQRKVVVAYDGSPGGEDALALGRVLAEVLGGAVVVATVMRIPDYLLGSADLEAAVSRYAEPLFEVARDELSGLEVETRAYGDSSPGRALHELLERESPIVAVVGASRWGPVGRIAIADVGMALLSGAPCPIALAPRGYSAREGHRLHEIGAAVDGAEESWAAFTTASGLAARAHGRLSAIAVAHLSPYGYQPLVEILSERRYEGAEVRRLRRVLDEAANRMPKGVAIRPVLLESEEPADEIAEAAAGLDLLLVGSRGYGPVRRALLGSVSAKLMRSSRCPLLVLPRAVGEDPLQLRARAGASEVVAPG